MNRHQHESQIVKSKPIDRKILQKLPEFHKPRDFVRASKANQDEFYGGNRVSSTDKNSTSKASSSLSAEEKNKIAAKILKAEMLGDTALVNKLKKQLEEKPIDQVKSDSDTDDDRNQPSSSSSSVLLTKTDLRSGLVYPVRNSEADEAKNRLKRKFNDDFSMKDLLEMEKFTTAEDQLALFGANSAKAVSSGKTNDDWTVDDVLEEKMNKKTKKSKSKHHKDKSDFDQAVQDYKRQEQTLDNCPSCVDSRKLQRHLVVTLGLKTYLAIPSHKPLVDLQCCIVPMTHASSCVQMDEDIYDEMKIWRKGLVAMFNESDLDVVFIEMAKNVNHQPHTVVECYPVPKSIGDLAPMYFKKALLECEEEWAQNKKIVDLSKKELRKSIPRGFSYFAVDFGLQNGYCHVIENEAKFPRTFGQEIISGMMDLDESLWRRPVKQTLDEQTKRADELRKCWTPFDWTERVKERLKNE